MRQGADTPFCKCEVCGDVYVLIDGYNDTEKCFWCKQGVAVQRKEKPDAKTE